MTAADARKLEHHCLSIHKPLRCSIGNKDSFLFSSLNHVSIFWGSLYVQPGSREAESNRTLMLRFEIIRVQLRRSSTTANAASAATFTGTSTTANASSSLCVTSPPAQQNGNKKQAQLSSSMRKNPHQTHISSTREACGNKVRSFADGLWVGD